jgi:iron complex outermembrane receptor protein
LLTLPHNLEWDTSAYFVGMLADGPIPAYTRLDTRLGWRLGEYLELSISGQNLLRPLHFEFADAYGVDHTQVARSVLGKMIWRF